MILFWMCRIVFSEMNIFLLPVLFITFVKIRELRELKISFQNQSNV